MEQSQSFTYGGFWRRFFALIIDSIILTIIFFLILFLIIGPDNFLTELLKEEEGPKVSFAQFIFIFIIWLYYVSLTVIYGGTIGKLILGLRVVDQNYQKISWGRAILREIIGKFISGLVFSLGYLWVIFDSKKQAWHDKIAGTYVVKVK